MNLALLRHLESSGKSAQTLFVNALRQTGQHHLANLLDESARIKALSGSGTCACVCVCVWVCVCVRAVHLVCCASCLCVCVCGVCVCACVCAVRKPER